MTPKPSPQPGPRPIEQEHLHLRGLLEQLRQCLAGPSAQRTQLAALLRELLTCLQEHFQHEEEGGYFAELVDASPNLSERADALCREHVEMHAQLTALHGHAQEAACPWENLQREFAQFLDRFKLHEAAENDMLQQAYCHDIGADD